MAMLITSVSGFFALFLIAIGLTLPYVLRWQARRSGSDAAHVWGRIRVHSWIGYAVLVLVLVHMYISMGAGMARFTSTLGLNLATLGLLLIFLQLALGLNLTSADPIGRRVVRRVHFAVMLGILAIVFLHLALNSVLVGQLLQIAGI